MIDIPEGNHEGVAPDIPLGDGPKEPAILRAVEYLPAVGVYSITPPFSFLAQSAITSAYRTEAELVDETQRFTPQLQEDGKLLLDGPTSQVLFEQLQTMNMLHRRGKEALHRRRMLTLLSEDLSDALLWGSYRIPPAPPRYGQGVSNY